MQFGISIFIAEDNNSLQYIEQVFSQKTKGHFMTPCTATVNLYKLDTLTTKWISLPPPIL
jgi:hypothetical protein